MVFFGVRLVLQFNLLALGNVCCPTRAVVLGLSFYPLEQAPNMVIYAMSKSGTATSGLIYVCGFFEAQAQDKRAPLLPKHSSANERLKGVNFSFFAGLALISWRFRA